MRLNRRTCLTLRIVHSLTLVREIPLCKDPRLLPPLPPRRSTPHSALSFRASVRIMRRCPCLRPGSARSKPLSAVADLAERADAVSDLSLSSPPARRFASSRIRSSKTMLALSVIVILPRGDRRGQDDRARLRDLLSLDEAAMCDVRGAIWNGRPGADDVSQPGDARRRPDHRGLRRAQHARSRRAARRTLSLIEEVGLPAPDRSPSLIHTNFPAASASGIIDRYRARARPKTSHRHEPSDGARRHDAGAECCA